MVDFSMFSGCLIIDRLHVTFKSFLIHSLFSTRKCPIFFATFILSSSRADSSFALIKKLKKLKTLVEFRLKLHNYSHAKLGAKTHGRPFLWHCQNSICTLQYSQYTVEQYYIYETRIKQPVSGCSHPTTKMNFGICQRAPIFAQDHQPLFHFCHPLVYLYPKISAQCHEYLILVKKFERIYILSIEASTFKNQFPSQFYTQKIKNRCPK